MFLPLKSEKHNSTWTGSPVSVIQYVIELNRTHELCDIMTVNVRAAAV